MPEPLRVALSVDALGPRLTGIGRYSRELTQRLPLDPRLAEVRFFRGRQWLENPLALLDDRATRPRATGRGVIAHIARRIRPPTIVHAPNYFLPVWAKPGRGVATIHDLSVFLYPETHPAERIAAFEKHFTDTLARAALLLTDSEWNRRELIAFAGLEAHKVRAVPLGVGPEYRPRSAVELAAPLARLGLTPGRYGLCVSTLEPRKRIDCLLDAWQALPAAVRSRFPLALAGAPGWQNTNLVSRIEQARAEGWLIFLGYVPEPDLPLVHAGARVFAYPSRYEGFGLPPLEAMASGVPTIVAPDTCVAEVTAGGARVVDVEDATRFSDALCEAIEDGSGRTGAIASGAAVAQRYTWEACISSTIDAYQELVH
ncbi:glycosyltransferase family 1 protein [Novosphingobium sp.]|uniref:glycosyltransferase family 4 protein n=1 Tax=Novosphingobium sp. TaxID=1874826 RepID=UPI0025CD22E1|nr:glycosyltransferase family 1 protein [Novosphingobium sp.]